MKRRLGAYMTVEAALIMSVVLMTYVFLIDCMIYQYERCVEELEAGRRNVQGTEEDDWIYETEHANPVLLLRLQRTILVKRKEEEKVK